MSGWKCGQSVIAAITAVLVISTPKKVAAAEIRALMSIGVQSVMKELIPRWERSSGNKINAVYGLSAALAKRVSDGEQADIFVGTRDSVDGLIKSGKVSGPGVTLAATGIGIALRRGMPKLDISTPDALRRTLIGARAVAYGNPAAGGAAGVHFAKVIERLGIVEEMKPKTRFPVPGELTANMLLTGEVDLAVQQIPELVSVDGVELVGPLPGDLQAVTISAASVPKNANDPATAYKFVADLRSTEAIATFRAKGHDPQ